MDIFRDLESFKENTAVIDDEGNNYTYNELNNMVLDFGKVIPSNKKSLILVKCKNTVESIVGYLGGIAAGQVVMLVDNTVDRDLLDNIIESYEPEYIWQPVSGEQQPVFTNDKYELLKTDYNNTDYSIYSDLSLLMLTSGSTGSPKGVRLTRKSINANAKSISEYLKLDSEERPITNLPMNYAYGLSVINSHLYVGATILLTNHSIIKKDFWDLFRKYDATSLTGVPYTYEMLKTLGFFDMHLPSLCYFTQAGGKLRGEMVAEYAKYSREHNIKFIVMYGQTEATARISYLPPEYNLSKNKSIGIAIPDGKLYLKDDEGKVITKPREEGTLYYEGANVMLGYAYNRMDLAKGDEYKGCLNTRDLAYFDEDGYFYIVGRSSRFIKILGKRMNLDEIEQHLKQEGFDCVCGGGDDLLLIAVTDMRISQQIKKKIIKKFKIDYECVDIFKVEEIKKNPSGKICYKEIFSGYKKDEQ
ncbi:AMP-binding protein [Vallitalea maricola]|uniref:Uncharacterized protein n=1 Tax=Vallitalea maricola TaxID=3074433 RepID=A0ACB5UPZ1_9FIRM|nr:hypothetical protein AN2V17_31790 [Vallitalea sp. AN17-2]